MVQQDLSCHEIIVVDDGSIDDSGAIVQAMQKTMAEPKVHILRQGNLGPAAARNAGIQKAESPYIAFLDSDDHWHKNKLKVQYHQLVKNDGYIVSHTREKWFRNGKHLNQKKKHIPRHGYIFDHCLQLCAVGMSTVMVKRGLFDEIGLFDESLPCCEDYDLWLRASCRHPFLLIDSPLTVKEGGRDDQVSYQYRVGMDRFRIRSLAKLLESGVLDDSQHILALKEFERKVTILGNGYLKHSNAREGQKYLDMIPKYRRAATNIFPQLEELIDG